MSNMLDAKPMLNGTCEYCGADCDPMQATCSLTCEAQLRRLEAAQGRLVIRHMKRWRLSRTHESRNAMMALVTPTVDRFLRNDQARREKANAERRASEPETPKEEP